MAVFTNRPVGYKVGLLLLLTSIICYITGFSTPYWTVFSASFVGGDRNISNVFFSDRVRGHNGLWETCVMASGFSIKMCSVISQQHGHPGWISGVQALQCLGLVGLVVASVYGMVLNFFLTQPSVNRLLESILLFSGITGFTGSTIYATQTYGGKHVLMMNTDIDFPLHKNNLQINENSLAWAYVVNLMGCGLALISAVVLFAQNRYIVEESGRLPAPGVVFSDVRGGAGGNLVFVSPGQLFGGVQPPPYTPQESPVSGSQAGAPGSNMAVGDDVVLEKGCKVEM